jgi:hypothetical protein
MCLERELACDERVLATTGARKAYATCLTHLAEHSMLHRGISLALGILGSRTKPSELSTRVNRILSQPASRFTVAQSRVAAATMLLAILGGSATLAHAPRLVSFAPAPNLGAAGLASGSWGPPAKTFGRAMQVKAVMPDIQRPIHRAKKPVRHAVPRVMDANWRSPERVRSAEPRMTLVVSNGAQVQQFVVPTVAYVPAYAAVRVPDGWIIFKL